MSDKIKFVGVSYGRGAAKYPIIDGCEKGPEVIPVLYPDYEFFNIKPYWDFEPDKMITLNQRLEENLKIQNLIYDYVSKIDKNDKYILIGGDHSVNLADFKAIADKYPDDDVALIYIDAHLDIHSPKSSELEASCAPHGMNVRHLLGDKDSYSEFLNIGKNKAPLKSDNLFYLASRSYEPSEKKFVDDNYIYMNSSDDLSSIGKADNIISEVKQKLNGKKFVLSFDLDCLDTKFMPSVQVPEQNGIPLNVAEHLLKNLISDNMVGFEFVEFAPKFDDENKTGLKNFNLLIDLVLKLWK